MNTLDPRAIIILEQENRWRMREAKLEREVSALHRKIGGLCALLKDVHASLPHPGTAIAIRIAIAIRENDQSEEPWAPKPTLVGKDPWKR